MEAMYQKYKNDVEFFIVYVREAHPNETHQQPTTFGARVDLAEQMCTELHLSIPTLIDGIDNKVGIEYAGMPDRIYLVGRDGKIALKGARGPRGFILEDLEDEISKELAQIEAGK